MVAAFALCLLGFFLGYWAGRLMKLDFPSVQTVAIGSGMRNISAGAVLAQEFFPPDVLFPVAFSPVFLQVTTSFIVKALRPPNRAGPTRRPTAAVWPMPLRSKPDPFSFPVRPPQGGLLFCICRPPDGSRQIPPVFLGRSL